MAHVAGPQLSLELPDDVGGVWTGSAKHRGRDARLARQADVADGVRWPDGLEERIDTVILGTGYRPALDFLPTEAFEAVGWPALRRGISSTVRGLGQW